jgi:hypothetical protein
MCCTTTGQDHPTLQIRGSDEAGGIEQVADAYVLASFARCVSNFFTQRRADTLEQHELACHA